MNLESKNYRATALRPAEKVVFFEEVLGNQVSKNYSKLGLISKGRGRFWVGVSDSSVGCFIQNFA